MITSMQCERCGHDELCHTGLGWTCEYREVTSLVDRPVNSVTVEEIERLEFPVLEFNLCECSGYVGVL